MRLLLVRHATTETTGERLGGRTPTGLSEEGRRQSEAVADRLATVELAAVYASPIVRTLSTARLIAARHDLEVSQLEGVQEFDYGDWTDRPLEDLRESELYDAIRSTPSRVAFPGGESFLAVHERATSAVESLVGRHADEDTVVVVSHADVIKLLVATYVGLHVDLFQRLVVSPASLSALALPRQGMPLLVLFNDTSHLADRR